MSTTVERPAPSGSSLVPSKPRVGDRVFKGLSTGAGVLIFVILGAVATFLLAMAFPALVATPAELEERGFGVRAKQQQYTINENLLGVTLSGGEIDEWKAPGEGARGWCKPRGEWPADALRVTLKFIEGEAVSVDGEALEGAAVLAKLNELFAAYGVGRGMYTGDTTIGLKGRIVYEAPGLIALLTAHRALEEAVLTKQQNRFKPEVARKWVELVYEGFFHDPLKADLEAFLKSSQRKVNGEVVLETGGARVDAVEVRSPHVLNAKGATYAQSADWGVEEAEGFIKLFGMSSTLYAQVNR